MGKITINIGTGVSSFTVTRYDASGNKLSGPTSYSSNYSLTSVSGYLIIGVNLYSNYTDPVYSRTDGFVQHINSDNVISFASYDKTGTLSATYNNPTPTYYYAYLKFNANGGSGAPSTQSASSTTSGARVGIQIPYTEPTWSGRIFLGWGESASTSDVSYYPGGTVYVNTGSTKTLYAIWNAVTYYYAYLAYNVNGGSGTISSTYNYSTTNNVSVPVTVTSATPTRSGYTFLGWASTSTASTASYYAGDSYYVKTGSTTTIYAVWGKTVYLTYNANGGYLSNYNDAQSRSFSYTGSSAGTQVYVKSASSSDLGAIRPGYSFITWNTASDGTGVNYNPGETIGMYESNRTLYAQWSRIDYTIRLYPNGGYIAGSTASVSYTKHYNETFSFSQITPDRNGYTFLGWSENQNATSATYGPNGSYTVTASKNFYAVWQIIVHPVYLTYNANGGYLSNYNDNYTRSFEYEGSSAGTQVIVKSASNSDLGAIRPGYDFVTWNTASDGTGVNYNPGESIGMYENDRTLYAQWSQINYTIRLYPNGGYIAGSTASVSFTKHYNETFSFSQITPTREHYTLLGWSENQNASTATYGINGSYAVTASKTFYAIWKVNVWTLKLNANHGTFPSGTPYNGYPTYEIDREFGSSTSLTTYSNAVSRPDERDKGYPAYKYEISGWDENQYKTGAATLQYGKNGTVVMPDNDLTIYAIWRRSCCVRYFNNGVLFGEIDTVFYEESYTIRMDEPTWGNHVFKGWSVNGHSSISDVAYHPGSTIMNVTQFVDLTACWAWESLDLFYWNGSEASDSAVFVSGLPVQNALLAGNTAPNPIGWNGFFSVLSTLVFRMTGSESVVPSYTSSGAEITAAIYNAAITELRNAGASSWPRIAASGDKIYPGYFIGTYGGRFSLRNSLNALITTFNASQEDE